MSKRPKLSHRQHTGRLRAHDYTSYLPLMILLVVVGVLLTLASVSALSPGPENGTVGLTGIMPGPIPTVAATITIPHQQQHFATSPVTVVGTCPAGTLVEMYKNDIFAGSTVCSTTGTYSLDVDLLNGQNILIARVYNNLNQPGPDSTPVTVFYDALPLQAGALSSLGLGGSPLLLNTDAVYRGVFPNQAMTMSLDILGGTPPYAVNIQWGDSSNKVVPRGDNLTFNVDHTYTKAGNYQIAVQASDAQGKIAFISVAAIVNGQPPAVAAGSTAAAIKNKLLILWPLYTSAIAVVVSFWLGERREKRLLTMPTLTFHPKM